MKTSLTVEESAKLIELGVSPERASMRESSAASVVSGERVCERLTKTKILNINNMNKNFRMFARRFEDKTERIEAIREFVTDNIIVGVDYADKENPVIKLYNEGENEPFAVGKVGDYVVNDNGTFRILSDAAEMIDIMLNQK